MAKFTPRRSEPGAGNKYYVNYAHGGYNTAIVMNGSNGYVIPNCVGYAQGRFREIQGDNNVWSKTGCNLAGNAETFYARAKAAGMPVGQTPKLGAIICWEGVGSAAGHVAVVEEIHSNGDIVTSNSAYNGTHFYMQTLTKASGYLYKTDGSRPLNGFVYCNIDFDEDKPVVSSPSLSVEEVAKLVYEGKYGNNPERREKLEAEGYNADEVQAMVEKLFYSDNEPNNEEPEIAPETNSFSVGDVVMLDSGVKWNNNSTPASWVFSKELTITRIDNGNLLVLSTQGINGAATGVISADKVHKVGSSKPTTPAPSTPKKSSLSKGETVHFTGNTHYTSSYSNASGKPASPCTAKVTAINNSSSSSVVRKYHLVGNGVYGWVDSKDIAELN